MVQEQVIPKSWYIASGILTLLTTALTQISLFDVLGYESSFALGIGAAVISWFWGISQEQRGASLTKALLGAFTQYLLPFAVMSTNALFVKNCSFSDGVLFFLALPISSALYVTVLAYTASRVTSLLKCSPTVRRAILTLVFLAPLAGEAHQFLTEPTIFFFNHAWGWYAGSIYDEGLTPDQRLAYFRLGTMIRMMALGLSLYCFQRYLPRAASVLALGVIGLGWLGESYLASTHGYHVDREHIESILSERVQIDGLVLHLDPSISEVRRREIIIEHAYRLESLAFLQKEIGPGQPIHSYVYRDAEQKGALMGGKRTMFAKPWLREIHIHGSRTPHRILGHELVHALLESRAEHPLGIPVANLIIPMMAWVEGFAEAFTPPRSAYDIHTYARWLQQRERLPRLKPLLSPWTFWRTAPNIAYPVMGSFIDFTLKRYGEKVLDSYRDGDIGRALGLSVEELESHWHTFLQEIELDAVTQRGAATRLRKSSLFDRPCARVIAALREEAQSSSNDDAPELYRQICDLLPGDPRALFDHAKSLAEAGQWNEFEMVINRMDNNAELGASQLGKLFSLQGERAWKIGKPQLAKSHFQKALELHTANASARLRWVAVQILNAPLPPELLNRWYLYLFEALPLNESLDLFADSRTTSLSPAIIGYLHGRRLYGEKRWAESTEELQRGALSETFMEAERLRLLRETHFEELKFDEAEDFHQQYLKLLGTSGERARAQDAWQSRSYAKRYKLNR